MISSFPYSFCYMRGVARCGVAGLAGMVGDGGHGRGKPWSLDKSGTYQDTVRGPRVL